MKFPSPFLSRAIAAALVGLASGSALAAPNAPQGNTPTDRYVARIAPAYGELAGSAGNLSSLVSGLRNGQPITLSAEGSAGTASSVTFTPPTRPMGYGNISRALDLADRELAAAGITQPTPQALEAALMGGTVSSANGEVALQGVLTLRSEGMGWGEIAHAVGLPPNAHASAGYFTHGHAAAASGIDIGTEAAAREGSDAQAGTERGDIGITTTATR